MLFDDQSFQGRKRQFAVAAVLIVIAISWLSVIERKTEEYVDESTFEALAVFGTLRLTNAAISVVKSIEVDVVVASVQFGQVLDPIDDLIEDTSQVLKFAIASLFTQKLLVEILSTEFFKILLTVTGLLLITSLYVQEGKFSGFLLKTFALVGLARFLFVLVIFLNGLVDQAFVDEKTKAEHQSLKGSSASLAEVGKTGHRTMSETELAKAQEKVEALSENRKKVLEEIDPLKHDVTEAQQNLSESEEELSEIKQSLDLTERYFSENPEYESQKARVDRDKAALSEAIGRLDAYNEELEDLNSELTDLNAQINGEDMGFYASAKSRMAAAKDMMDFEKIKAKSEQVIDSMLRLMALFVLKTVIVPIIFLVLLLKGFRYIWGIDARDFAAQQYNSVKSELNRSS